MKKIFEIRFLAPPILAVTLIFLSSPTYFLGVVSNYGIVESIAFLTPIVFAVGVIISGIVESCISFKRIRQWGYINYTQAEQQAINNLVPKEHDKIHQTNRVELGTWLILGAWDKNYSNLQDQIQKRWYWATANFNLVIASSLAFIFVIFEDKFLPNFVGNYYSFRLWLILFIFVLGIFGYNAIITHNSVREMHRALIRNYDRIKQEK
jgi:hypothetical protein